ncbi:Chromosome segregation in meiosis protein 3 [Hypsizygus marmoreus]|uniref:Chromosome segregation in meiosis protein n=1 Tax=Hypsizygus marmoreus TaxID=39966 RepID=A0A369JG36_HYPMA|nr:Chromosome segregation in meiosis protein 3 [Hypsizygus marmoreus]
MASLDDIWDEPAEERVQPARQQALFLADSDDDEQPGLRVQNAPEIDIDIDAMFADVDNEDDPFNFKPLAPTLDTEALRREAESRHKKSMLSLTPHAILPSSSPPRDIGDSDQGAKKTNAPEKGKEGKKERRKVVRLDEGRLLGPTGFPQLIKDTKNFKIKGKGHEVTDLNRLLQVYGYWTHAMYPKTVFRDTVERVEKLCHSKRMHVALSVWRDEAHGLVNGKEPEDAEVIDLTDDQNAPGPKERLSSHAASPSNSEVGGYSSSRPPSRPPSSGTELEDDDDFDIDALIRDEEERKARERDSALSESIGATNIDKGKGKMVMDVDDDAAMWEELDAIQTSSSTQVALPAAAISGIDDDQAMWDELDALNDGPATISVAPIEEPVRQAVDEDEDMWNVVREMENATAAPIPPVPAEVPVTNSQPDEDDDWESMYL